MKSSTTYVSDLTTIGDGTQHMIGYAQNAQAGYIEAPTNAQQQDGVVPLDRLPAQWWNWFLNKATRRFTESEDFLENAVAELDNILDVMGITPDPTSTTQLKTMFSSNYLQQYLPKIAAQASAFSVDGTHENYIPIADNDGNNGHTLVKVPFAPSLVVNTQLVSTAKNITLPANCPYNGQTIKVVFSNGHQAGSASDHMTLNVNNGLSPAPIVSNQNGTLDYLPIHELTEGTYSVLQANTVLEMYYTETGFSGNPAWVIVGNPVVLSSSTYTIYANGKKDYHVIGTNPLLSSFYSVGISQSGVLQFQNCPSGAGICMNPPCGRYLHFDSSFASQYPDRAQVGVGTGTLPAMMNSGTGRDEFTNINVKVGHNVVDLSFAPAILSMDKVLYLSFPQGRTGYIQNIYISYNP